MRELKTYGVSIDGRNRGIVATTSKSQAAKLFGLSINYFNTYGGETHNPEEVTLAMSEPGVVWTLGYALHSKWMKGLR